jgi:hypothetical protein
MVMPGASMLTKVIIMACSGKAGAGQEGRGRWSSEGRGVGVNAEFGGALLHVGGGGLVAVVAVGDEEPLVGHGVEDFLDDVGDR